MVTSYAIGWYAVDYLFDRYDAEKGLFRALKRDS